MFEPELEILAEPAATVPPVGSVLGATSAYARLRKVHGSKAAPTARAMTRGCVRGCRPLRAPLRGVFTCVLKRLLGLACFVVAMVLSL
jgi:hypothetical protein